MFLFLTRHCILSYNFIIVCDVNFVDYSNISNLQSLILILNSELTVIINARPLHFSSLESLSNLFDSR